MVLLLLAALATAGSLILDAKIPAELRLDSLPIAKLYQAGVLTVQIPNGEHQLTVYTSGRPTPLHVNSEAGQTLLILAGKSGVSVDHHTEERPVITEHTVRISSPDLSPIWVRIGDTRYTVSKRQPAELTLPPGDYEMTVHSASGSYLWASGTLILATTGEGDTLVQVSEGKMPEIAGQSAQWLPKTP